MKILFRYFVFFCLVVVTCSTISTLDAFPFGKKKDQSSEEKKEKKGGLGSKVGGAFGSLGQTVKNVGEGGVIAIQSKLPGQEDAGREKVEKIIRNTHSEMVATRSALETEYDELRARFFGIVGITQEEASLAPEDSLIYEVQRFDAAIGALEVPSVEEVQSKIGIGMDNFLDTSGAVDHAKYASTAELLTEQIGPRAKQLRSLLKAQLESDDKRAVVTAFKDLSQATQRTVDAQNKFIREAQALELKTYEKIEASKKNFRDNMTKMAGIIGVNTFAAKQVTDFANVGSSDQDAILISYLGAEASDDIIDIFKVIGTDGTFWDGLDKRADEMEVFSQQIFQSVKSVYSEFGSAHQEVSQIATEVGEEKITGYFAQAMAFENELAAEPVD